MTEKVDYLVYYGSMVMHSSQPMKSLDAVLVGTRNYIFMIPKQTTGMYAIFTTFKNHALFEGLSIEDGVKKILANAESVEGLEKSLIALLQDDTKYVHKISEQKSFKFRGFLGKHTLRMSTAATNWTSLSPKGKGTSKEFRAWYGQ